MSQIDDGSVGVGHGLLVERCRFLEAAGCASVCMNTCKAGILFLNIECGLRCFLNPLFFILLSTFVARCWFFFVLVCVLLDHSSQSMLEMLVSPLLRCLRSFTGVLPIIECIPRR